MKSFEHAQNFSKDETGSNERIHQIRKEHETTDTKGQNHFLSFTHPFVRHDQAFSVTKPLPKMFSVLSKRQLIILAQNNLSFPILFVFGPVKKKNVIFGKELTLSQTTNFRLVKLKEFPDDNFNFEENGRKLFKQVENTVGKGEIARYEQFLLFPQC